MGTWEIGNFGNDAAMDWVNEFIVNPSLTFIRETIAAVFEDEFLELDVAYQALSATEVIAASRNNHCSDFPEEISSALLEEIGALVDEDLVSDCKRTVVRIMDENDNELLELWREAGPLKEWLDIQQGLVERLA